jgi:hypothetical protein
MVWSLYSNLEKCDGMWILLCVFDSKVPISIMKNIIKNSNLNALAKNMAYFGQRIIDFQNWRILFQ